MEWHTAKRAGTLFGSALLVALLLFDVGLLLHLRTRPVDLFTFFGGLLIVLSPATLAVVIYWLIGLRRSGYALDRNQLTIVWGPTRHIIPTRLIDQVIPGEEVSGRMRFSGGRWPGLWVGSGDVPEIGLTLFNATAPLDRQLFIITDLAAYAISPIDREGFVQALETRKAMGPTQDVLQEFIRPAFFSWPLWSDRLAQGLTLGAGCLCLALFAYVCFKYPDLPSSISLHFDAAGIADRFGGPAEAFILPVIGLLALGANTLVGVPLYLRERIPAYLLWGGAILVQALLWIAAVTLLV
ncbi:MAG TPA: PH domain-containing protein [Anaerolineae bacterium]|nr:PH domain-containing protein [Anaerolineae bacterium]